MLLLSIVLIGVTTMAAAELWSTEVQREREEELIFRLNQFRQAIARYRADHNRLPKELKDLLEDRTQITRRRYLRQIYADPMTRKPDWQLKIVADRTGAVSGIEDVRSKSEGIPIKNLGPNVKTYKDW